MVEEDVERRLHRVRNIIHAQSMVLLLKGENVDNLVVRNIQELIAKLQNYKYIKANVFSHDEISAKKIPYDRQSEYQESLLEMLADKEEQMYDTLEMLEDHTCLLGESKKLGALEVMKDLNEATEIFKRRIRRKMDREKQDEAVETEGASVA